MTSTDEDHQRGRAQGRLVAIVLIGAFVAFEVAGLDRRGLGRRPRLGRPQVIALVLVARKVHRTPSRPAGP